jgi:Probable zinc-ribbon domain
MKSGKQRRIELKVKKQDRKTKLATKKLAAREAAREVEKQWVVSQHGGLIVDPTALAQNNSYSEPEFMKLGYYLDKPFNCAACKSQEVWTAAQQKWWYEVAKGSLFATAKFCRTCRNQEKHRRAEARRVHLEGIAKKTSL